MRVDTNKLEAVRDAVDLAIVEAALGSGLSRAWAAAAVADRAGFSLRVIRLPESWVVYAVSRSVWRRALALAAQGAAISATGTELLEREPWHYESASRDEAMVATLCRLLDEAVDVGVEDHAGNGPACSREAVAMVGMWFEVVKQQWAKLATTRVRATTPTA